MNAKYIFTFAVMLLCFCAVDSKAQTLTEELEAIADIVVDIDGTGDYSTIHAALNAIPDFNDEWKVIFVKDGFYYEKLILDYKKTKVVLVGESADSTIISYDDHADAVLPGHTFSSYTFRADAHDFQVYNLTFVNPEQTSQAVAFHSNGDRQILYHVKMLGYQDTYFDNFRTRRYMKDCYIEGAVDYIFGFGVTLFDSCHIHATNPGYITAASTPEHYEFGYVFKNCAVTVREGGFWSMSLGRPWFPYSNTIFFECWLSDRITPGGWSVWGGREETCIYREYNNFGPGASPETRVEWSSQLDPDLASRYNIDTIFARSNFPYDLGEVVDSVELWSMRDRFEASGYADRADTILYAGRDHYPEYPTDDWSPEFYAPVYDIVREYTSLFMDGLELTSVDELGAQKLGISFVNPVQDELVLFSEEQINENLSLSLYDLNGRKLMTQSLSFLAEGMTSISLPAGGLQAGAYFYYLQGESFEASGKLVKL